MSGAVPDGWSVQSGTWGVGMAVDTAVPGSESTSLMFTEDGGETWHDFLEHITDPRRGPTCTMNHPYRREATSSPRAPAATRATRT